MESAFEPDTNHIANGTASRLARTSGSPAVASFNKAINSPLRSGVIINSASNIARVLRSSARRSSFGPACVFSCGRTRPLEYGSTATPAMTPVRT